MVTSLRDLVGDIIMIKFVDSAHYLNLGNCALNLSEEGKAKHHAVIIE